MAVIPVTAQRLEHFRPASIYHIKSIKCGFAVKSGIFIQKTFHKFHNASQNETTEVVSLQSEERSGSDNTSPFEGIEQISRRRPGGVAITYASSVPGDHLPVGKKGENDSAGNLGVHQHLGGVSQTP